MLIVWSDDSVSSACGAAAKHAWYKHSNIDPASTTAAHVMANMIHSSCQSSLESPIAR